MEGFTHEQPQEEELHKTIHCQGCQSSPQTMETEIQLTAAGSTALLCLAPLGQQREPLAWQGGQGLSRGRAEGFPLCLPLLLLMPCSPTDTNQPFIHSLNPWEPEP